MNLKWLADHFQSVQALLLGAFILLGLLTLRSQNQKSNFKVREADRTEPNRIRPSAFIEGPVEQKKAAPLSLPGMRLKGEPNEILGIRSNATEDEIMKSFKELMKKYHPDVMQGMANGATPEQLKFYQEAATQINHAKEKMLLNLKKK